jgi:hypothetical protein
VPQLLDNQDTGSFAHHETVSRHVEGARGFRRRLIEARGKGPSGGKSTKADDI